MATQKSSSRWPKRGRTQADKRTARQVAELIKLVPRKQVRDLMREMLNEADRDLEKDDTVILPDFDPKEVKGLPKEIQKWAKDNAGKRVRDLPKPTKRQRAEELKKETNSFVTHLSTGWLETIWLFCDLDGQSRAVRLDNRLLPIEPNQEVFDGLKVSPWLDAALSNTKCQVPEDKQDKIVVLFDAFIGNLKAVIDKHLKRNPEGYLLIEDDGETLIISRDEQGYFLRIKYAK